MWKLSEINIRNIVSFREASFVFEQGVATLIFGRNEDNASQPCNGSGKSSFIEAISLALTGEQLRKVKSVEEIINDTEDEAYVSLRLNNDYDGTQMTINRCIRRNGPQIIQVLRQNGSYDSDVEEIVQPTVADYNKYILNEIGLTKDDIYNNFILCDNKYESFFDCSDRNKKEIINRFSNGEIVDESISRVQADIEPVEARLSEANSVVTGIKGSISAIENELSMVDEKKENAKQERAIKIDRLDKQILQCRENIENCKAQKTKAKERLVFLSGLQVKINQMEESDLALLEAYSVIKTLCEENSLGAVSEFDVQSEIYKGNLAEQKIKIEDIKSNIQKQKDIVQDYKTEHDKLSADYKTHLIEEEQLKRADNELKDKINQEIKKIDAQLDNIEDLINANKKRQAELEAMIARESAMMSGVIVCPKCSHKFFVNSDTSVEDVRKHLVEMRSEVESKKAEVKKLDDQFVDIDDQANVKEDKIKSIDVAAKQRASDLEEEYRNLRTLSNKVDKAEGSLSSYQKSLIAAENELDRLNGKIEVLRNRLFGEINGILEGRIINGKNYITQQESSIKFAEGQMSQYQVSKKELIEAPETDIAASLKSSLEKYQSDLTKAENEVALIQSEYNTLKEQEINFTMFKSYIARKKIDALSLVVNDFLEKIGSDIRLRLDGFTVTKTGKLRDKISVQVMRDGIDCGSYHKFSGGEKARLNLACILSLHTLTNSNCEEGKGLDFIIIDELLDKSDEVGMATYCEALNKLHQTALLITQGGVSEGYPHKLLIVKKQGVSEIQN